MPVSFYVSTNHPIPAHELHAVLSQAHNDLYKEVHGIRPRWIDYTAMPTPELEAMMLALMAEAEECAEKWAEQDALFAREEAEAQAAIVREAERAIRERWMDQAAMAGACGW